MLEKAYEPKKYEDEISKKWENSGFFNPDVCKEKGVTSEEAPHFSVVLPPPNVTGTLHMGHAAMLAIEDTLVRYHRMKGDQTLWVPGTDHAAVATESKVEGLLIKEGMQKPKQELGREEFLNRVKQFAQESHDTIVNQCKKMGSSLDWSREAYTLDDARNRAVREVFKRMYEDGLIYRGYRVVNWSVKGQSTCSDDELEYIERPAKLYYFKYNKDFPITIATTRPETKLGDTAVAVHPNGKWKKFIGKTFEVEDVGQKGHTLKIKIIASESVDENFGTGALGVTPAHSMVDFDMYQEQKRIGDPIELTPVIGEDGCMTENAGSEYQGLTVEEARAKFVEYIRVVGLLEKEEDTVQNVGTSDRFKDPVEPLPKTQWFVDVNKKFVLHESQIDGVKRGEEVTLKELMQKVVQNGQIEIIPDRFQKTYFHWIDNLRDWCISRQIWFGHRIPVWYKKDLGGPHQAKHFNYKVLLDKLQISQEDWQKKVSGWKKLSDYFVSAGENPNVQIGVSLLLELKDRGLIDEKWIEQNEVRQPIIKYEEIYVGNEHPEGEGWVQDPDTLDTWFSSGLWTFSTLGWPTTSVQFIRHGEAENNVQGKLDDGTNHHESHLTEKGEGQIRELAKKLKENKPDIIFTSPVARTKETAEILSSHLGVEVIEDERLREVGVGKLNGKQEEKLDEVRQDNGWTVQTPYSIEPYDHLRNRTHTFLTEVLEKYRGRKIAVVSHGDVLEVLKQFGTNEKGKSWEKIQGRGTVDTYVYGSDNTLRVDLPIFHPTSVLETGYDILFFWVARMILMTTYTLGTIPFQKVYLHGLVRDEQGRKMSKTLGNIIDPLDMIEKYGTDATRLSLLLGNTPGNDMKLSEEKIAGFRNFANKLWNMSRFMMMQIGEEGITSIPLALQPKTLADEWILTRLERVRRQVTENIEKFQLASAGDVLRDFTWNELADWYLEIAKVEGEKTDILSYLLPTILKLWHPFMPFVTETIWQECIKGEDMLLVQKWPGLVPYTNDWYYQDQGFQSDAEKDFALLQKVITRIRTIRNDYNIEPAKKIDISVKSGKKKEILGGLLGTFYKGSQPQLLLEHNKSLVQFLARVDNIFVDGKIPANAIQFIEEDVEVAIDLSGAVDAEKEITRIEKEMAMVAPYVESLEKKLSGDFAKNAPAAIVEKEKQKFTEAKEKLEKLQEQLSQFKK